MFGGVFCSLRATSQRSIWWAIFAFLLTSCGGQDARLAPPPERPQLWYWLHSLLNSSAELEATKVRIDRAYAEGYTGIAFWDVSFMYLNSPSWPSGAPGYLREGMAYAQSRGLQVLAQAAPYGYSNDVLNTNPNWAEGQRVVGSRFEVDQSGRQLRLLNSFPGISNGGFESDDSGWIAKSRWGVRDQGVEIDPLTSHSGASSGVIRDVQRIGRFHQRLNLTSWRQYHLRLWVRTQEYRGPTPVVEVIDAKNGEEIRLYSYLAVKASQDWTQIDTFFNSGSSTFAELYFGVWGPSRGAIWFDDVSLEETALVNLLRRSGTPVKVYGTESGALVTEGIDVEAIKDPNLTPDPRQDYHDPPVVRVPVGSRLKPGDKVSIDFYEVQPAYGHQMGLCLTEPAVRAWDQENARTIASVVPPGSGVFLMYDETRQMNSCALCRSRNLSAGEILAWHVSETIRRWESLRPGCSIYVWSDMFDPYANAHDHYFFVEGNLAGSWKGLPAQVTIMNWDLPHRRESLKWFSGTNWSQPIAHRQIIAGYYDSHDGRSSAIQELQQARGVPGIDGLMYTTWEGDDSQAAAFAEAARQHWAQYRNSINTALLSK